jgi:hypothetical protein
MVSVRSSPTARSTQPSSRSRMIRGAPTMGATTRKYTSPILSVGWDVPGRERQPADNSQPSTLPRERRPRRLVGHEGPALRERAPDPARDPRSSKKPAPQEFLECGKRGLLCRDREADERTALAALLAAIAAPIPAAAPIADALYQDGGNHAMANYFLICLETRGIALTSVSCGSILSKSRFECCVLAGSVGSD